MGSEKSANNYNTFDESDASNYDKESDASNYNDYSKGYPTTYVRKINLRYFAAEQLRMLNDHARLKELCLENDNPEIHYIEGLLQYFVHNNTHKCLCHLRQSATGNNANALSSRVRVRSKRNEENRAPKKERPNKMGSEKSVKNYNTCDESDASNYNNESDASNYNDYSNSDPNTYFRKINLRYFAVESLQMLNDHARLKELCLENVNPEAHYNEGLLHYFVHNDKHKGFYNLRQSSTRNNENGTHLYGLLMLARGHYPKGKKYLDKLQWKKKISTSDHCWERIKNSLSVIRVPMNRRYYYG